MPTLLKKRENLRADLAEVLAEIEHRKKVNPLSFFEPLPLQKLFRESIARVKALYGGNRSGKTEEGAEYVESKCLAKPKQRWWACAESFSDSVNIQQRKVWNLVPKNRIKYGHWNEITGFPNRKLLLDNGSIIIFKSYDQGSESFASEDLDGIWNDEEVPYAIFKEQKMRLLDRNGEMIFTMTSTKGITEFIQEIFEDYEVIKSQYAPLVDMTLPRIAKKSGIEFYFLWTTENPYIDQHRVKFEATLMSRDEKKARLYGLPINLAGKIYMIFNRDVHVVPFELAPRQNICLYHILDPHDRKPWAMKWIVFHKTGSAYCVDEYPNQDFNEMLYDDKTYNEYKTIIADKERTLLKIFGVPVAKRIIDPNFGNATRKLAERQGGQSHTTVKRELERRGLFFKDGIDALEDGHLKVREMLNYYEKNGEIVMQPKYFITENCENSIRHLSRYSRKDIMSADGDVKDKVALQQKYKDYCDLDRYFWMSNPKMIDSQAAQILEAPKVY